MGSWTDWRKLAEQREWYPEALDHDGPACYELGTAGSSGGRIQIHYVGATGNERRQVAASTRSGTPLAAIIAEQLGEEWSLFYRAWALPTEAAAIEMQKRLLTQYQYDWNAALNP